MTYEEFKKTGKDGVYRADLDEWFVAGAEPPVATQASTSAQEPAAVIEKKPLKGKDHD